MNRGIKVKENGYEGGHGSVWNQAGQGLQWAMPPGQATLALAPHSQVFQQHFVSSGY